MKTLFSAAAALIFSLASVSAATVDLDNRVAPTSATVIAAVSNTFQG